MSQDSADLIAQHAVLLPSWLAFLDTLEAEQDRLQQEMQAAEVVVPMPGAAGDAAATVVEAEAGAEAEAGEGDVLPPAARNGADPVAWLRGQPTAAQAGAEAIISAPLESATGTAASGFEPTIPEDTPRLDAPQEVGAAAPVREADAALPDTRGEGAPAAPPAARTSSPLGSAAAGSAAEGSHAHIVGLFEADFGGAVAQEFGRALAETDAAQLPYSLRETMQHSQEPEEVAAAFVRSARAGELPTHLEAAVERMEEVDYHFRDVGARLASPTMDDDPPPYF